jgi:ABC-type dipeptide/oligopeptide/nickel transport system permease component
VNVPPPDRQRQLALLGALARRFGAFVLTLLGAALLAQVLLWSAPGDAADLLAGDPELRAALVLDMGLARPPHEAWWAFVTHAAQGDLGRSLTYRPGMAVIELVRPAALRSLVLVIGALFVSLGVGAGLAYVTAGRRSVSRRLLQAVSIAPVFLMAWVVVIGLNEWAFGLMQNGTIGRPGWFALPDQDSLLKWVLAVTVLAVGSSAVTEVHSACEDELKRIRRSGYVDAARARGERLWPHVIWNLVPPLTTVASSRAAFFVGGLVVVEKVLHLNGVGAMLWQACRLRDVPLALGITFAAAAVVCGARLIADLVRVTIDPRLRTAA